MEAKVALLRNLGEEQVMIHKYFETTLKLYFTKTKSNAPILKGDHSGVKPMTSSWNVHFSGILSMAGGETWSTAQGSS